MPRAASVGTNAHTTLTIRNTTVAHIQITLTRALPGWPSARQFAACRAAPKSGVKNRLQLAAACGFQSGGTAGVGDAEGYGLDWS